MRVRLIEIGDAVKAFDPDLLATESAIPWREIAAMRDRLGHRYFDTSHAIVAGTVRQDLSQLEAAVDRLTAKARTNDC